MKPHPYNVRPVGNALSGGVSSLLGHRRSSLGKLSILPDAILVRILEQLVSCSGASSSLTSLSNTSTYLRAFALDEDHWRTLIFQSFDVSSVASVASCSSWFEAFRTLSKIPVGRKFMQTTPVYSDILFHKWRCLSSHIYGTWRCRDNVPRISGETVSVNEFRTQYERPGRPVIITDVASKWPAIGAWTEQTLTSHLGDIKFHAGGFEFRLADYFKYCAGVEHRDDQPLYIFDRSFAEKAPALADAYSVPEYFSEDLFQVLGEQQRPDYRWLIIGPARSGSSFHKDPNGTAAWNAVIKGAKKWVMFPPDCPPPGVEPSGDEGDVTAPVSVTEWFLNFYDPRILDQCGGFEGVVREGEIMFVPHGWWHCVLNTETSVAITQNYVSSVNVCEVAKWLHEKPHQISGCRSDSQSAFIRENFVDLVIKKHPELQASLDAAFHQPSTFQKNSDSAFPKRRKTSLWEELRAPHPGHMQGFRALTSDTASLPPPTASFSFGF